MGVRAGCPGGRRFGRFVGRGGEVEVGFGGDDGVGRRSAEGEVAAVAEDGDNGVAGGQEQEHGGAADGVAAVVEDSAADKPADAVMGGPAVGGGEGGLAGEEDLEGVGLEEAGAAHGGAEAGDVAGGGEEAAGGPFVAAIDGRGDDEVAGGVGFVELGAAGISDAGEVGAGIGEAQWLEHVSLHVVEVGLVRDGFHDDAEDVPVVGGISELGAGDGDEGVVGKDFEAVAEAGAGLVEHEFVAAIGADAAEVAGDGVAARVRLERKNARR